MNNSSENRKQQKNDENFFNISPQIAKQLKYFVSEKYYLFDYYRRHRYLKKPSLIEVFWDSVIIKFYWRKRISRIITYIIIFLMSFVLVIRLFVNKTHDNLLTAVALLICLVLLIVQLIIFWSFDFKNPFKNRYNPVKCIDFASQFDPRNHLNIIKNIAENNSVDQIKIEEQRFKIILIAQTRANDVGDSVIPLISFFYALFILFMLGTPENWGESLNIATILGFGFIPLITTIFSFLAKLSSENLVIYQHCLFILQEALVIAQEKEQKSNISNDDRNYKLTEEVSTFNENTNYESLMEDFIKDKE